MAADPFAHARPNWTHISSASGLDSGRVPLASTAPVLKIYEEAVQEPGVECRNIDSLYSQAQLDDSDRYDARILREDFCSTAIIATTWAGMDARNRSQGVDIDLVALKDTHARLRNRPGFVQLLQSPGFAQDGPYTKVLSAEALPATGAVVEAVKETPQEAAPAADTWAPGAATERFDRKRNKKLAKQAKKDAAIEAARAARAASQPPASGSAAADGPKMKLLHSDVLDLPVAPVAADSQDSALEAPDVIASLNYAMAYFHDRATLLRYLRMARATLRAKTGVFITDMFGGPSTGESYPDQDATWARFQGEVGFGRDGGDARGQYVLRADRSRAGLRNDASTHAGLAAIDGRGANRARPARDNDADDEEAERVLELMPAPEASAVGTRAEWPRGKLKLVRTGEEHGGFEYWREDGPVDWMTNRFRMSLSFRFSDASWLRDVFWYDFRVWSIKELTEAMEEAGFVRVQVHILPRNIVDSDRGDAIDDRDSDAGSEAEDEADSMAGLLLRTEKEERNKSSYTAVKAGEKVFANRSFASKFPPSRIRTCRVLASEILTLRFFGSHSIHCGMCTIDSFTQPYISKGSCFTRANATSIETWCQRPNCAVFPRRCAFKTRKRSALTVAFPLWGQCRLTQR